ncbi:hypothetical protein [Bacillus safensis]|uniref:hypothetical protein n=1 Tax=Bacillus safensis TaxID=561879 RepID=UPI0036E63954
MKPEITKEQAEAIEFLRNYYTNGQILDQFIMNGIGNILGHDCGSLSDLEPIELASALINGYEIVMTPEEKVRAYYESNYAKHEKSKPFSGEDHYTIGVSQGIKRTLDYLGIKIEGVNADREEADVDDAPF